MRTDRSKPPEGERVLRGLGVSAGVAIGPAHLVESRELQVPERQLAESEVAGEAARFAEALEKARRQISKLKTKASSLPVSAAEEIGFLLDAHLSMLTGSRLVRGVERRISSGRMNAEAAVHHEITALSQSFERLGDAYLAARAADVREVGSRLIRTLMQQRYQPFSTLPEGSIVLAEELTPADTALMDPARVAGFASVLGGAEGHTAIMARSLGLPAVLGVAGLLQGVRNGDMVIVDGIAGRVFVNPGEATLAAYRKRQQDLRTEREQLKRLASLPAATRDGTEVALLANLELPRDVPGALEAGAAGVGLLRTEFLYMNRDDLPGEDEQYEALRSIVEGMGGRPITARTLDVGGEKLASALGDHFHPSANPALGLRAVRLGLKEPRLLEIQLAAMLRASAHGPLRILLPMICSPVEVRRVREMMHGVAARLRAAGTPMADPLPPLGCMIEIPGAALAADGLALCSDFFAIGTNDLTQYTLAIDRGDEQVAYLYDPLHPAVLRLIQFATGAAKRAGIPISLCGEIAGDPRYTALLVGLGIRELSMSPGSLLAVKRRLRTLDMVEATRRAGQIMEQTDRGRIATLLDDLNGMG
ncbi:phosphoenolpyruvate--protein phosphotransferase [Arenibaculum pallidiluteum]|uniref:phosphoenolpyruvate--protein phosphotransferase n=1 Tax=Arenibaculum pallidiluteum TaxID=2812559 RepID=UPI001A976CCB|nr:phosphoenolpyruvate--protein phosphotransferase [Arenibaculum pallidiluteum]